MKKENGRSSMRLRKVTELRHPVIVDVTAFRNIGFNALPRPTKHANASGAPAEPSKLTPKVSPAAGQGSGATASPRRRLLRP